MPEITTNVTHLVQFSAALLGLPLSQNETPLNITLTRKLAAFNNGTVNSETLNSATLNNLKSNSKTLSQCNIK